MCNFIEEYLKNLLREGGGGSLELQRNELAERFGCAPSQINYVLSTRFSPVQGYQVESRRGGGGYIRVTRLRVEGRPELHRVMAEQLGNAIAQDEAVGVINWLIEEGAVTDREARLMQAAVQREAIGLALPIRDQVRASILKSMLVAVLRSGEE